MIFREKLNKLFYINLYNYELEKRNRNHDFDINRNGIT